MPGKKFGLRLDIGIFVIVLLLYIAGQFLIGSYDAISETFIYNAPADVDFLYYAGIINQLKYGFPPQNPACGGEMLSQSFFKLYPTVLISLVVNPYVAMRIMNLVYLIIIALVLNRYYSLGWSMGLITIAAGSVGFGLINSLGVDLIARGFTHFPFFIALVVALHESERKWLRYLGLVSLGWLHSYSAFIVLLYLIVAASYSRFDRQSLMDVFFSFVGLVTASLVTLGVADKPFYFMFSEGFEFDLSNLWMHALIGLIPILLARKASLLLMFIVSFLFGLLFHYNPFFPIFIIYFTAGLAMNEIYRRGGYSRITALILSLVLICGFMISGFGKYRSQGVYYPHLDRQYVRASEWLRDNSPKGAVLLTVPLDSGWRSRLMEIRAVYLGFIPHVAHLGIDWRQRGQNIINYFTNPDVNIGKIDYVVFGPMERSLFPGFSLHYPPVYTDEDVTIWKVSN